MKRLAIVLSLVSSAVPTDPLQLLADAALLRRCHRELPLHLRGPSLAFWPFHVLRAYAAWLREAGSAWRDRLDGLVALAAEAEAGLSPAPTVFAHNDLLAANLVDDGSRLWLIDWDYAGWGSPVFDLANLAANNGLDAAQEFIEEFEGQAVLAGDGLQLPVDGQLRRRQHVARRQHT